MLVIDPEKRMSVDEALNYPYINVWYEDPEVNAVSSIFCCFFYFNNKIKLFQTAPGQYNHIVDEREYTVDQWKELIFHDVIEYELDQIKKYVNEDKQSINQLMDQSVDQPME